MYQIVIFDLMHQIEIFGDKIRRTNLHSYLQLLKPDSSIHL